MPSFKQLLGFLIRTVIISLIALPFFGIMASVYTFLFITCIMFLLSIVSVLGGLCNPIPENMTIEEYYLGSNRIPEIIRKLFK